MLENKIRERSAEEKGLLCLDEAYCGRYGRVKCPKHLNAVDFCSYCVKTEFVLQCWSQK